MRNFLLAGVAAVSLGLLAPGTANADVVTYTLDDPNSALSGFPSPFGSVTVNRFAANEALITFQAATPSGGFTYSFIDGGSVGVNANGASTISNITGNSLAQNCTNPGTCYSDGGSGMGAGFFLSNTVNSFDGFADRSTTISFDLTLNSGSWQDAAHVLSADSLGFFVGSHSAVANGSGGVFTGFVGGEPSGSPPPPPPPPPPIPEPASLAILGTALLGLGWLRWLKA